MLAIRRHYCAAGLRLRRSTVSLRFPVSVHVRRNADAHGQRAWLGILPVDEVEDYPQRDPEKELPTWAFVAAPASAVVLMIAIMSTSDIKLMLSDRRALQAGGWVCQQCLAVNEVQDQYCKLCKQKQADDLSLRRSA
ncbi:unnamed protein product [Symbiodinium pilosum]|uniref:RanBP2-type domain-containing protein n=1 Tax=Symbiodinium pilosum TaxID=2952 RepID=A0A812U5G3_SYMPI|nr:unnamed protein product [Symbiodinium pilosum]